ncbi:MAG: protein TolR [Myxococcota bacterium]|nr:protein TolR [Myxococcota bacterium]
MALIGPNEPGGMMAEINVTPFVDVMLVLLVIFMVTAPLMVTGMQVELPQAEAPPLESSESQMVLSIDAEGQYFVNETALPLENLDEKLLAIAKANPRQEVFVKADGTVPYAKVARLIAAARAAGIPRVGLVTQPEAPTP